MVKKINGYENYTISDGGEVFNTSTNRPLKGSLGENGYRYFRLSKNNKKTMFYGHRLVAEAFLDNPNNLPVVNHKDGNKLNNNVSNLEWVSYSENSKHAHANGLVASRREKTYYNGDLPNEQWKKIYDWPYSISSLGRVRNDRTNLILKPSITCGYYKVRLSDENNIWDFIIHNNLYCIFNGLTKVPDGYVVDHINANKLDNRIDNLRLITLSENVNAAYYQTKTNKSCKKVLQFSRDGEFIADFPSTKEAGRMLHLDASSISKVCRGVQQTCGGYIFKYDE